MKFLIIVPTLLLPYLGFSQSKPISTSRIKNLEKKALICIDSNGKKTSLCSLDLDGFKVEFFQLFFDQKTKNLRIIGRLAPAIAYVGIFLGNEDSIFLPTPISRTSNDKENINNDGFFDVSFNIKPNIFLYFYERPYFARQFNIAKFLKQQ